MSAALVLACDRCDGVNEHTYWCKWEGPAAWRDAPINRLKTPTDPLAGILLPWDADIVLEGFDDDFHSIRVAMISAVTINDLRESALRLGMLARRVENYARRMEEWGMHA